VTDLSFEDRIMQAVVAQFFAPQWQQMQIFNPSTGAPEMQLVQHQAPVARISYDIFAAKHDEILEAVKERIDIEELADAIAGRIKDDVVDRMTKTGMWSSTFDREREEMRTLVNRRIADELARRALEKMDADAEQ
jgi:hypothetical protein